MKHYQMNNAINFSRVPAALGTEKNACLMLIG